MFMVLSVRCTYALADETMVVPSGETVGIKLYTDGLLVIGTSEVKCKDGTKSSPASECGLKINDIITEANNTELKTSEQFSQILNNSNQGVNLTVKRSDEYMNVFAVPKLAEDETLKLGLWVRDSTAGIGTVTYLDPQSGEFAALGHGICDVDTGNIMSVKSGNILNCSVLSVKKSEKGAPGELGGVFDDKVLGAITKNTPYGIFGKINTDEFPVSSEAIPVADAHEVKEGDAYILSDIDGSGAKKYDIKISKILKKNPSKCFVFEVNDKLLSDTTGGIVQGMSGSPIIQNGKLIGAVTHVFVNNPEKGYGIFAENIRAASDSN